MSSIGAKLAATSAIVASSFVLSGCSGLVVPQPTSLSDAPATRALVQQQLAKQQALPHELAAAAERTRIAGDDLGAVRLAERAIQLDPNLAKARKTLAQSYFSLGRFQSSAEAYGDLMAMQPTDAGHQLGAAIAALTLGETMKARLLADRASATEERHTDVALVYVLLGDFERGIAMLENVVRSGESTPRTRQNLALAQALSGEWNDARVTAAMDLAPQAVEERIAQWAALAVSDDPAWRTVSLVGVNRHPSDAGRPIMLAWQPPAPEAVQLAAVEAPAVVAVPAPTATVATVVTPPVPAADAAVATQLAVIDADPELDEERVVVATISDVAVPEASAAAPAPVVRVDPPAVVRQASRLTVAPRLPELDLGDAAETELKVDAAPASKAVAAETSAPAKLPSADGGDWLVQLGSYAAAQDAKDNWLALKRRTEFLSDYTATRSRAAVDGKTYYRLSVGKFGTPADAKALCAAVKKAGESCFVRAEKSTG